MKTRRDFGRILLVLGGGGLRGLAHIGALKALKELDLWPHEFCGTSVGSLIAACAASDLPVKRIEQFGLEVRRDDVLDFNLSGILRRGSRTSNLHDNDALEALIKRALPYERFADMPRPLFVNTVNINTGGHVVWGLNSLTHVTVQRAVLASCSIPGVFPPVKIGRHWYVDGAVANNLVLSIGRARKADLIVAVNLKNLGSFNKLPPVHDESFLNIIDRADNITAQQVFNDNLSKARDLPYILVQPDVVHRNIFDFDDIPGVIQAGYQATLETVRKHPLITGRRRRDPVAPLYALDVDACAGCGLCALNCDGHLWTLETPRNGPAKARYNVKKRKDCTSTMTCVRNCPYNAISVLDEGTQP